MSKAIFIHRIIKNNKVYIDLDDLIEYMMCSSNNVQSESQKEVLNEIVDKFKTFLPNESTPQKET